MSKNNWPKQPTPTINVNNGKPLNEDEQILWREFNEVNHEMNDIGDSKQAKGLAAEMGRRYQLLVRAGLMPQIKKKYRGQN